MPPEASPRQPLKVAHRGWHLLHLENTLEAFRAAYDAGCDLVEFDVQISRDGVPVIFHDDDCRRLAGRPESLHALDWKELRKLRMRGGGTAKGGGATRNYRIPSLEEFLEEFGDRPFYLELKIPRDRAGDTDYFQALGRKAADMVMAAGRHRQTFLASFHGGILRFLHREGLFPVLAGIFEDYGRFLEVHSGKDAETAAAIRHYSLSWALFRRFLKAGGEKGKPGPAGWVGPEHFLIWDIAGEAKFETARKHNVLGLVTDDVKTLLRVPFR